MKVIDAKENESILVDAELKADLLSVGLKNFENVKFIDDTLKLPNFTVGEIRLENHLISIKPLNGSLSLENVFEMFAYIENADNTSKLNESKGYGSAEHGFDQFVHSFLSYVNMMSSFGLSSIYQPRQSWERKVRGVIDATKYSKKSIAINGVRVRASHYSKDSFSNRIIYKALLMVKDLYGAQFNQKLTEPFSGIQPYKGNLSSKDEISASNEYSPNPYHSITLAYALMIIKDLSIGYSNSGNVKWHSFLVNSNQVYEKYLRTLISRNITASVQKLPRPITFASNSSVPDDNKFLEPDILINFNKSTSTAQTVLDAKNKSINVRKPLSKISTNDLYQISYYAQLFKAKSGVLVYPVSSDMGSVRVNILSESSAKFYIVGINMNDGIELRHSKFISIIESILRVSG